MRLLIAAVGRLKDGPERQLYDRYAKRIASQGRSVSVGPLELAEIAEGRAAGADARMTDEGERLAQRCINAEIRVLLDENGKGLRSREIAELIRDARDSGAESLAFLIGGPDGHGTAARAACRHRISLGSITLPHGLARVVLAEQLYRAVTIIARHPYHRD